MKHLREIGRDLFGRTYLRPFASALRADPYALRRWAKGGKAPANLSDRVVRMLRALVRRHVGLALSAAELVLEVQRQSDISDITLAGRLRDLNRDLTPRKPAPPVVDDVEFLIPEVAYSHNPNMTLDELLAGQPDWLQQQIREMEERPE
jgi:hypothetical protein